jgi:glycosyltransferase involved in cell wall biosynthesis
MKISVVIPVRNEERSIRSLLDALLSQTLPPDEIVITDGGSTDATVSIIQDFINRGAPVSLIRTTHALPGRGRNLAAARAGSEWLAFTDAGIRPAPNWLSALAARAALDSEIDVVYGSYEPLVDTFFKQ